MRNIRLALLLLGAVTAFATPGISAMDTATIGATVGAEVSSDPLPFQVWPASLAVPAIAMARDRTGVVIAWSMWGADGYDRISVARLDATAHFTGKVTVMPVASTYPVYAIAPSIARLPGGDGFTLAWTEQSALARQPSAVPVYSQLDSALKPSVPVVVPIDGLTTTAPAIVRSGKTTWIMGGKVAWQIQADGTASGPLNAGTPASDMIATSDFPQLVSGQRVTTSYTCMAQPGCTAAGGPFRGFCFENCRIYQYGYVLQFVALYQISTSYTFSFDSEAAPAIQSDSRDVMVAWFSGLQRKGGSVEASRLTPSTFADFPHAVQQPLIIGSFNGDAGATRPDIATDGERYVVVWRTTTPGGNHDIAGASIDRAGNILPLSIATSAADERDPSVVAVGNATFLVAYDKISNGERRIAGRLVTFDQRSRAVR